MSARYSSSPALLLRIGNSRHRTILYIALCLLTGYALWGTYTRGHGALAILLAPLAAGLLWRLRYDSMLGAHLHWCQGCWTLQRGAQRRIIALTKRSTATPWLVYLEFRDIPAGPGGQIWLYADSVSGDQLRRLRVRLALMR